MPPFLCPPGACDRCRRAHVTCARPCHTPQSNPAASWQGYRRRHGNLSLQLRAPWERSRLLDRRRPSTMRVMSRVRHLRSAMGKSRSRPVERRPITLVGHQPLLLVKSQNEAEFVEAQLLAHHARAPGRRDRWRRGGGAARRPRRCRVARPDVKRVIGRLVVMTLFSPDRLLDRARVGEIRLSVLLRHRGRPPAFFPVLPKREAGTRVGGRANGLQHRNRDDDR